jgi:spore germination protein YaaH
MTPKVVIIGMVVLLSVFFFFRTPAEPSDTLSNGTPTRAPKPDTGAVESSESTPATRTSTSVFIPYWADLSEPIAGFDRLYYFGIVPTVDGIDRSEAGYAAIPSFVSAAGNTEKWLTIRMVERETNAEILSTAASWQKIVDDTLSIRNANGFTGVVLNLEVGLLALDLTEKDITEFTRFFSEQMAAADVPFAITAYGDSFFRKRPYNFEQLAPLADHIIVMTYDFHKSFGLPGPNFPLNGKEKYRYDLASMIDDYLKYIPPEKITIVLGRYGYEWIVDDQNRPLKAATAITENQVESRHLPDCSQPKCTIERDSESSELTIRFAGESGRTHVIWLDDETSTREKIEYLNSRGIGDTGFWAYSFF